MTKFSIVYTQSHGNGICFALCVSTLTAMPLIIAFALRDIYLTEVHRVELNCIVVFYLKLYLFFLTRDNACIMPSL